MKTLSAEIAFFAVAALLYDTSSGAKAAIVQSFPQNDVMEDIGTSSNFPSQHDFNDKYDVTMSSVQIQTNESPGASAKRRLEDNTTNSNLICVAGDTSDEPSPLQTTVFEFWYGVETTSSDALDFLFPLEEQIFDSVSPQILWCYQVSNATGASNATQRNLEKKQMTELEKKRELAIQEARRLGIVSFSSGPADVVTTFPCPFNFTSRHCFMIQGLSTLLAHSADNLDNTITSILRAIQTAMDDNWLLSAAKLPTVSRVVYLGTNETEAISGAFLNGVGARGPGTNGAPVVVIGAIQGSGSNDRGNKKLTLLAIPIIGVLAVLLLFLRQRRSAPMNGLLLEEDDMEESDGYVLVGTGDPPGSFHHGHYHYMLDGTHYLSTNCDECYQTRRRGSFVYSDRDLPTILEDHVYDDDEFGDTYRQLVAADSKDLGAKHSGANVHQCNSGLCEVCLAAQRGGAVTFIPSSVQNFDRSALTRFRSGAPDVEQDFGETYEGSMDFFGLSLFETIKDSADSGEA